MSRVAECAVHVGGWGGGCGEEGLTLFGLSVAAMPAAVERIYVQTIPDNIMKIEQTNRSHVFTGSIAPCAPNRTQRRGGQCRSGQRRSGQRGQ